MPRPHAILVVLLTLSAASPAAAECLVASRRGVTGWRYSVLAAELGAAATQGLVGGTIRSDASGADVAFGLHVGELRTGCIVGGGVSLGLPTAGRAQARGEAWSGDLRLTLGLRALYPLADFEIGVDGNVSFGAGAEVAFAYTSGTWLFPGGCGTAACTDPSFDADTYRVGVQVLGGAAAVVQWGSVYVALLGFVGPDIGASTLSFDGFSSHEASRRFSRLSSGEDGSGTVLVARGLLGVGFYFASWAG